MADTDLAKNEDLQMTTVMDYVADKGGDHKLEFIHAPVFIDQVQKGVKAMASSVFNSGLKKPKYDRATEQKGFMSIINFTEDREGSEKDVEDIKRVFEVTFKFDVTLRKDRTKENLMRGLNQDKEHICGETGKNYYCFILVIMGHGNEYGILTHDGKLLTIQEIIDIYKNTEMQGFIGKPKMFFVQSCRGSKNMDMLALDLKVKYLAVQQEADILMAYSTTEDHTSGRNPKTGAVFIQKLLDVIKEHYKKSHLEEMLAIVRDKFAVDKIPQMPCTWSTLTKFFYLENM